MPTLAEVNNKVFGSLTSGFAGSKVITSILFIFVIIFIIGIFGGYLWWRLDKKQFSKRITAFEVVGSTFDPVYRDLAKVVKLGKGGFEVLFLKKLKTWKLAYGGRVGRNDYYFFIAPDGYWYNGKLAADISTIDQNGGFIPIVTTNPLMRAQYTALEKNVDDLYGDRKTFWDKYGSWILSIAFITIMGVFIWLAYREYTAGLGQFTTILEKLTLLTEEMTRLASNFQHGSNGIVPAP